MMLHYFETYESYVLIRYDIFIQIHYSNEYECCIKPGNKSYDLNDIIILRQSTL